MAFKDITKEMYGGTIRIEYKDKPHVYYAQEKQENGEWGRKWRPKGTTTLLGDTLEKKGLMTWPLGLALTELFGFYDFVNEQGNRLTGFSKKRGVGTLWGPGDTLLGGINGHKDNVLPLIISANRAWQRKQKQGADVGALVHDAIEQLILGTPFELTLERYEKAQLWYEDERLVLLTPELKEDRDEWLKIAPAELEMAKLAYGRFVEWWNTVQPKLLEAENIVYSKEHDYSGSYDARLIIPKGHHPVYQDREVTVMTDWKTSNASKAGGAPMGIYYSYFIQDAAYARALWEMTGELVDDLLVVSCRKDGNFDLIYASQLGITVEDAIKWWEAVVMCYRMMDKSKKGLLQLHKEKETSSVPQLTEKF